MDGNNSYKCERRYKIINWLHFHISHGNKTSTKKYSAMSIKKPTFTGKSILLRHPTTISTRM
jgi:stress-induced morphogen